MNSDKPWAEADLNLLESQVKLFLDGKADAVLRSRHQNPMWCANTMLDLINEIRRREP